MLLKNYFSREFDIVLGDDADGEGRERANFLVGF